MTTFDTVWPADSVEFCPIQEAQNVFVCGTYKLDQPETADVQDQEPVEPTKQHRRGKCLLYVGENDQVDSFSLAHEASLPAILDMKWSHGHTFNEPLLGIADSEGHVSLHTYASDTRTLQKKQEIACADPDTLVLSLDWSDRRYPTSALGSLVVSLSNGSLAVLRESDSHELAITDTWHCHDYEPWIAAWNYWNPSIIYSGGDDLKMRGWDVRVGFSESVFTNKRFDAGVTTIQSHPFVEHLLAVGSYDNTVRIFDARNPLKPISRVDVGGGAWRVKWHPSPIRKHDLLVACMHDGCKVIRFDVAEDSEPVIQINSDTLLTRFDKHESMAYGADWSFASTSTEDALIGSCSFYDHVLQMWRG